MAIDQDELASLENFIGREQIIDSFKHSLRSAQSEQLRIFAVKGNSGTGKTELIGYLAKYLNKPDCPDAGWKTGYLMSSETLDFLSILTMLAGVLEKLVPPQSFSRYQKKYNDHQRSFDQFKPDVQQTMIAHSHARIDGASQHIELGTVLIKREEILRGELSKALNELAKDCEHPLCLFIDNYEQLAKKNQDLSELFEVILPGLARSSPQPILVMTCGWEWPDIAAPDPFMRRVEVELTDFDLTETTSYLQKMQVISSSAQELSPDDQQLVTAFYDLTKGHPLILGLAVMDFTRLSPAKRTAESLRTSTVLQDEPARVQFLQNRLLNRLPDPDKTLLERGPILRSFDLKVLDALLSVKTETTPKTDTTPSKKVKLYDEDYRRFCKYPFVNRQSGPGRAYSFHGLTRRVGLEMLRDHPQTKEKLHRKMVDYYRQLADTEQKQATAHVERLGEEPDKAFKAVVERLYHALQVRDLQGDAFTEWHMLTEQAMFHMQRQQIGLLLELMRQLAEEGEPLLGKTGYFYARYRLACANSLASEFRLEEALTALQEAVKIFERGSSPSDLVKALGSMSEIYFFQGNAQQALQCCERALIPAKQLEDDSASTIWFLVRIGFLYAQQGDLKQALDRYQQAYALFEHVSNPMAKIQILESMISIYLQQGQLDRSLSYSEQLLSLYQNWGNFAAKAQMLNRIGLLYQQQAKWPQALDYYQQALPLLKQTAPPFEIVNCLYNIGITQQMQGQVDQALKTFEQAMDYADKAISIPAMIIQILEALTTLYQQQGQWQLALQYYERALSFVQKFEDPTITSGLLATMGFLYQQQMQWEQALDYYQRAIPLLQATNNTPDLVKCLNSMGSIYQYQGVWQQALDKYKQALALQSAGTTQVIHAIGSLYQQQQQWEQALNYYESLLPLFEIIGNATAIPQLLSTIGNLYSQQGKWQQAIETYTKLLTLSHQAPYSDKWQEVAVLQALATCYEQLGDHQKSLEYQQSAEQLSTNLKKSHSFLF
ncbi:MAG TPA: tetratricopeptide repeat protein [Ktedonobacteraceae bacterium]|nr:tetratricopeptide repeat protein [Ktedonobacteraceae bacterium]